MKSLSKIERMVFPIAFMLLFLMQTSPSHASSKDTACKELLIKNGLISRVVKIDRNDGFIYGLSFKGKKIPTILIAPGPDRMFLVQVNGREIILQRDEAGKMEVVLANGDISYVLCILKAFVDSLQNLQLCGENDFFCYLNEVILFINNLDACNVDT